MSEPLQHYVPKFMLRRFSSGERELVHALDKHEDKIFASSTSRKSKVGVVAERAIYDFEFHGVPMTLEAFACAASIHMSTPITLTVGNIVLAYDKGHIGIDHGTLFQERDRQRRRALALTTITARANRTALVSLVGCGFTIKLFSHKE
jgi:hypothetical protein